MTEPSAAELPEPGPRLNQQLVMFLDFLGVSEGARNWDVARVTRFIPLLQELADARAPFSIEGKSQDDGSYKFTATAEISTFSDNVVASYPIVDDEALSPADQMTMYLAMLSALVATIARKALDLSILVRGGISYGRLYHRDGVVFGPAMVDAYLLESKVANYPRVVIAPAVYKQAVSHKFLAATRAEVLLQDVDGVRHLNYFTKMRDELAPETRMATLESSTRHIEEQAAEHERAQRLNEYAKWKWFQSHYQRFASPQ